MAPSDSISVLSILVGFFGGRWLDAKVGAHGWLTIIGFGFGVAAGFLSVYRAAVKMRRETEAEDERERRARKRGDHGQRRPRPQLIASETSRAWVTARSRYRGYRPRP